MTDDRYSLVRACLVNGDPLPADLAEWTLDQLAEAPGILVERDRLIRHHVRALGQGRVWRGCELLAQFVAAEHPRVADLLMLGCAIPGPRRMYDICQE